MSNGPLITDQDLANALSIRLSDLLPDKIVDDEPVAVERRAESGVSASTNSGLTENNQATEDTILPLAKVEENAIRRAVDFCDGNVVRAAGLLQVSPSTLYRKMQNWADQPKAN